LRVLVTNKIITKKVATMKKVNYSKKLYRFFKKLKRRLQSLSFRPTRFEVDLGGRS
jgi:hypothetical protein